MNITKFVPALVLTLALQSIASAALASNEKAPPFTQADCANPVLVLTLTSQADADSFPCTSVAGDLDIRPKGAGINSLSPGLDKLTRIDGELRLRFARTPVPTNLSGLNNVTHLGSLWIDANISGGPDKLQDITALGGVTSFGPRNCQPSPISGCEAQINIRSSDITQLPAWSIASSSEAKSVSLSGLPLADPTQLDGLPVPTDRVRLGGVTIDTDQTAQFTALERITGAAASLVELDTIPGIKRLPRMTNATSLRLDALGLTDLGDITPVGFPALTSITLSGLPDIDATELAPIRDLQRILLNDLTGLTGTNPLAGLSGGSFQNLTLFGLSGVATLIDLSTITSLDSLSISTMTTLTNLDGLQNLTSIADRLSIENNANLQNVDGLSGLASVGGVVLMKSNSALTSLDGLRKLTGTVQSIIVFLNGQLSDITGLAGISGVSSTVYVGRNAVTECDVLVKSRLNPAPKSYIVNPPCSFTAPALASSASSLDFGSAPIGNTIDRSVTLNNSTGTISTEVNITGVTITGDALGEYSVLSEDCTPGKAQNPLTGGSTRNFCTVTVRFTVTQQGVDNAQLNLAYTTSENSAPMSLPVTLTAAGTGVAGDQLTPNTNLDFGMVEVGASKTDTITIDNTGGSGTLTVSALTVTGSDFSLVGNSCGNSYPQTIAVGNTCAVSIQFTPGALNARSGQFTMDSDGATSPDNVNLLGSGVEPPAPVPNPTSLNFGDVAAGTSSTQTVTVTNIGALSNLTLGQLSAGGDFSLQSDTCSGANIAAGGNCTVVVEFTPGAVGSASETLVIPGASGFPSASVALSGNGLQPASLIANPTILAFGTQTQLATLDVTITNIGAAGQDAQVGTARAIGSVLPAQYFIASDNCSSTTLSGQATCQISVSFDPRRDGADTGSLEIPYNNGETLSVALSGRGGQPVDYITPSSLSFGNIEIGNSSPPQTVTVTDNSGIALDIAAVTSSGTAFTVQNDNCGGTTVNPGGSCTFDVVFNAITRIHEVGTIEVISNSGSSPDQVLVDGYGAKPGEIALSVTNVDFGAVPPGDKRQQPVTITNSGDLDIAVPPIVLSGDAAFSVESDTCKGVTLAAAGSCSFGIAFAPTTSGDVSAQVKVNPTINVTGSGATAAPVPTLPFMAMVLLVLLMGLLGWTRLRSAHTAS